MSFKRNSSPTSRKELLTIDEVPSREPSNSPEPHLPSNTEVNHFQRPSGSPSRRNTHPQGPLRRIRSPTRTFDNHGRVQVPRPKTKAAGPFNFKRRRSNKVDEGDISIQGLRRQSTGFSDSTCFSASFDETAVWDQKVILSLGMLIYGVQSPDSGAKLIIRRWRWNSWILSASDTASPDASHWQD